jgi:GTP cyclohydrolase II
VSNQLPLAYNRNFPTHAHNFELLRIGTTQYFHCNLMLSFCCSTMMTRFHSGPFFPPTTFITTNWENLKFEGGGAQGPVSQNCTSGSLTVRIHTETSTEDVFGVLLKKLRGVCARVCACCVKPQGVESGNVVILRLAETSFIFH